MKKWWMMSGILILVLVVALGFTFQPFKIINAWSGDDEPVVLPGKAWKVQFSEQVSAESLNAGLVYVKDFQGKKVDTPLTLSEDKKTVTIHPPKDGYDARGKKYTVQIKRGLKSSLGQKLQMSKSWSFVIKETLPVIESQEKLTRYFRWIWNEQSKLGRGFFTEETMKDSSKADGSSSNSENLDFSATNHQVEGVDEADIVKTDGKNIFKATGNTVQIIQALPADQMKLLSTLDFDERFSTNQLFLDENRLIVLGSEFYAYDKPMDDIREDRIAPMMQSTKVLVYDVKHPERPVKIREIELEGSYITSRKVNGLMYMITQHYPDFYLLEENENMDIRPKYSDSASNGKKKAIGYESISYFPESKEPNFTMIAAFDLNEPTKEAAITTYLGSGNQVYMSKENLYLAVPVWSDQPKRTLGVRNEISIISPDTDIHKFSIDGMDVKFSGSASVEGAVLNQFSMDENDGYFRIVTTKGNAWDEKMPSSSQLIIFDEHLLPVGKLEKMAKGEKIYSARFMGDRIYMVTFKQTDPLFVIDASNPGHPKVMGELKIPGFSNYLHPYDENHIIGFGQNTKIIADKNASSGVRILTDGVKISMFDVSDMSNPKETSTEIIGGRGTYSPLNYDHKALLFNKNKNLFAFPITVYRNSEKNEYDQIFEYQGAYVYQVDPENGFKLSSKITHIKGQSPIYEEYGSSIERLLYIGDTLYALSPETISSHDLKTHKKLGELKLSEVQ